MKKQGFFQGDSKGDYISKGYVDSKTTDIAAQIGNINTELNTHGTSLADIAYHVGNFGAVGDGVTDDTNAFQLAFAAAHSNGRGRVTGSRNKTYRLTDKVVITGDNIEFDGQGCSILWDKQDLYDYTIAQDGYDFNNYIYHGVFQAHGTITSTVANINAGVTNNYRTKGIFTVDSTSGFAIGDYVIITLQKGATWETYSDTALHPKMNIIAEIIDIIGSDIHTTYAPYFDYYTGQFTGNLKKVNPIKNFTAKNFSFYDNSPFTFTNAGAIDPNVYKLVCCLSLNYTVCTKIENITGENTKMPFNFDRFGFKTSIYNSELINPACVGGGQGYNCQSIGSFRSSYKKMIAYKERHNVDFSSCAYCRVEDSLSIGTVSSCHSFGAHGQYEHDIEFIKCSGVFSIGNSGAEFGNAGLNFTLDECTGMIITGAYSEGLKIINSDLTIVADLYQLNARDSVIHFGNHQVYNIIHRGQTNSKFYLENCTVLFNESFTKITFSNYKRVKVLNCDLSNIHNLVEIWIQDCKRSEIKSNYIYGLSVRYRNATEMFIYEDNEVHVPANNIAITSDSLNKNCKFKIRGNKFYNSASLANAVAFNPIGANNVAGISINGEISENTVYKSVSAQITYFAGLNVNYVNNFISNAATQTIDTNSAIVNSGNVAIADV